MLLCRSEKSFTLSQSANRDFAVDVVRQLQAAGYQAVWAGGCVRDQCLGLEPKDYDVATSAVPDQVRTVFGKSRTWAVGEAFGVIVVRGPRGADQIEVATFRTDGGYSDGRRPDSVKFSSAEEDAQRRDFTINGMFFDPLSETMVDYVGGQADLERKIVRAIGDADARFTEDKLRMLRAIRFAAKFQFELEAKTLAAIQSRPEDIHVVSGERIGSEMTRMLTGKHASNAIRLLVESRLLGEVLPEATCALKPQDSQDGKARHVDTMLAAFDSLAPCSLPQSLALLLRDWDRRAEQEGSSKAVEATKTVSGRWRLTNQHKSQTLFLLENEPRIRRAKELPWPNVQRTLTDENADSLIQLAAAIADATCAKEEQQHVEFCAAKRSMDPKEWNPDPILNGDDLRKYGVEPGPIFKKLLTEVRDAQLEGKISDQNEAWELVALLLGRE